jgi:hypothetical protein
MLDLKMQFNESNLDDEINENDLSLHKNGSENNIKKDLKSIIFLVFLYLLQGIPLGLASSLPFILSSRNVSYSDQGMFSFSIWPFSLKLLWAPIVDSCFIKTFGRRKSWLIPVQYLIGTFLILFSNYVHKLLEVDTNDQDLHKGKLVVYYKNYKLLE